MPDRRLLAALLVLLVPAGVRGELRVGVGRIEITPPLGSPMAGYSARKGDATSVHDPLEAGAILLTDGATNLALLTFDLRGLTSPRIIKGIRALGIDHVVLASSHTHSGPDADNETFPGGGASWRRAAEERMIALVQEVQRRTFPATLTAGTGSVHLGHNRRWVDESGEVTMLWRNAERRPTHPIAPRVGVIRIDERGGPTRAILVHYACHPTILGPDNLAISADYPGAMRRTLTGLVQEKTGAEVEVFFLQGAAGDLNPYMDKQPVEERAFEIVEEAGEELAREALRILEEMEPRDTSSELWIGEDALSFEHRWEHDRRVELHLTTVTIGPDLALVAVPGEPFVEFQLSLRARSPIDHTFLVGYAVSGADDWPGYIPTIDAAMEGGYGADYNTFIEVGAGETLIDRAVIQLYRAKGLLDERGDGTP